MATILAVTSLELPQEQEEQLKQTIMTDLATMYKHALSVYLTKLPHSDCRGGAIDQITFFVCVPPYISIEKKRETIVLLNEAVKKVVPNMGEMKNIVLFQYHADDGVGKDGELFADIKARQAAEQK